MHAGARNSVRYELQGAGLGGRLRRPRGARGDRQTRSHVIYMALHGALQGEPFGSVVPFVFESSRRQLVQRGAKPAALQSTLQS
jgi:hypothetical protein